MNIRQPANLHCRLNGANLLILLDQILVHRKRIEIASAAISPLHLKTSNVPRAAGARFRRKGRPHRAAFDLSGEPLSARRLFHLVGIHIEIGIDVLSIVEVFHGLQ